MKALKVAQSRLKAKVHKLVTASNMSSHKLVKGYRILSKTDVLGSYTGNPTNVEMPVQDADDL